MGMFKKLLCAGVIAYALSKGCAYDPAAREAEIKAHTEHPQATLEVLDPSHANVYGESWYGATDIVAGGIDLDNDGKNESILVFVNGHGGVAYERVCKEIPYSLHQSCSWNHIEPGTATASSLEQKLSDQLDGKKMF